MAERKMVQSMKTFKHFFEDSDYDIFSVKDGEQEPTQIGSVDDTGLTKIKKFVSISSESPRITKILNNAGYFQESAFEPGGWEALVDLMGDLKPETLSELESKKLPPLTKYPSGSISDVLSKASLSIDEMKPLMLFKTTDAGGSKVGRGEIVLALIFKDVKNISSGQRGDLSHNGLNLEVKGNKGRLGTQGGRGTGGASVEEFLTTVPEASRDEVISRSANNRGNVNDVQTIMYNAYKAAPNNSTLNNFKNILSRFYKKDSIAKYITKNVFKDISSIKKSLLKTNAESYIISKGVDELLFIDTNISSSYVLFNKDTINDMIDSGRVTSNNYRIGDWYPNITVK